MRTLWVQENGAAIGGGARPLIQHCRAPCLHLCQRGVDIVYFQADMVQPFAALLQKARQAGISRERLDQFDLAAAGAAHW